MFPTIWATRLNWSIPVGGGALMVVGWLGISRAEEIVGAGSRFFWLQIIFSAIALTLMFAVTAPNYRALCRYSYLFLAASIMLLVAVFFFPKINGAHRWIRFGPIGVQPSELTKVAMVLALARWLMHRDNFRSLTGLTIPLMIALLPVVLILREPDLGTALVFLPVVFAMLFAAGARRRDLAVVALLGLLTIPLLWTQMSREQKSRVTAVLGPSGPEDRPDDDQYHLHRAKQTILLGGLWGSWISDKVVDDPRRSLVPASTTDSIFCVLGERFGLWGLTIVLGLYWLLVWRILSVGRATQEPFGRLVCVGIAALIAVQVLINTAMMVGMLPITGLSLPLVSYGGTGLLANALALGLVLNIGLRPGYEVAGEPFRFVAPRRAA